LRIKRQCGTRADIGRIADDNLVKKILLLRRTGLEAPMIVNGPDRSPRNSLGLLLVPRH
jgi:hypothetical protein